MIEGGVHRHPVEPRGEPELLFSLGQPSEHFDQHLLSHVLRLVRIVDDPQREVVDGARIRGVERLERLRPRSAQAGDERRLVGEASRAVRLWLPRPYLRHHLSRRLTHGDLSTAL